MLAGLIFSERGVKDWLALRSDIRKTEGHIRHLESQNEELGRRLDLLNGGQRSVLEEVMRLELGMVKADEIIYQVRPKR